MNLLKDIDIINITSAIKPIEGEFLYNLIIENKFERILETGMGKSTLYSLAALKDLNVIPGRLISVDSCDPQGDHNYTNRFDITLKHAIDLFGYAFSTNNWIYNLTTSQKYFELGNKLLYDLFIHDSEHTESNLTMELNSIEDRARYFLCHDCIHDFAKIVFEKDWFKAHWIHIAQTRHYALFKAK